MLQSKHACTVVQSILVDVPLQRGGWHNLLHDVCKRDAEMQTPSFRERHYSGCEGVDGAYTKVGPLTEYLSHKLLKTPKNTSISV